MELILASGSPRRKQLLEQVGYRFRIVRPGADESYDDRRAAPDIAVNLAARKARAVLTEHPEACVVGADTLVVSEGDILGKPQDATHALDMLHRLNGKTHQVVTGVACISRTRSVTFSAVTDVRMAACDEELLARYVQSQEPMDKAGAYGIQGLGALLVAWIEGDYNNVVGLPLQRLSCVLRSEFGIKAMR